MAFNSNYLLFDVTTKQYIMAFLTGSLTLETSPLFLEQVFLLIVYRGGRGGWVPSSYMIIRLLIWFWNFKHKPTKRMLSRVTSGGLLLCKKASAGPGSPGATVRRVQ